MKRLGRVRLAVDIPDAIHEELKRVSKKHNCTITKYVIRAIIDRLRMELKYE
jgi:hypothetical protein